MNQSKRLIALQSVTQNVNEDVSQLEGGMLFQSGMETVDAQITILCTNFPPGSTISFSCNVPGPNPPMDMPPVTVTTSPEFESGQQSVIPAKFSGLITYKAVAPTDSPFTNKSSVKLQISTPSS